MQMSDFSYVILPGRFYKDEEKPLFEKAYRFWRENWDAVYKELNAGFKVNPDDFFKQDFIPVIVHEENIVAIHLYSLYDIRSDVSLEHSYLSHNFNHSYFEDLRRKNIEKVMSMESLFVNPAYRKSKTGISMVHVLGSLGQRVFLNYTDAHAIIAPARNDNKVSNVAYEIGFEPIQREVTLNNVPVDLLICRRDKVKPVPGQERLWVEYLWKAHQQKEAAA